MRLQCLLDRIVGLPQRNLDEMEGRMSGDQIDEAFRARRSAQDEQAQRVREKRELSVARTAILDSVRSRVLEPALASIGQAFERNGCLPTGSRAINEAGSRSGFENQYSLPGITPGQAETIAVSAVAAFPDPAADAFRVTVQVAERREQSEAFSMHRFLDDSDRTASDAILKTWIEDSLQRLVVDRLGRRGI